MSVSGQGFPARLGKLGRTTITRMSELAIESAPKRGALITALIGLDGIVWIDRTDQVGAGDVVATFNSKSDPDWLADELRFEARARGFL